MAKSSARGILLNPNATDTDGDGLADGQELFVKSVKTPKRTPLPDQHWTYSEAMTLPGGGPAWAVASATLMTGFTHPDMGQVDARLVDSAPSPYGRNVILRQYANAGQANNFTSYDLANLGYPRDELVSGGPWFAYAYDRSAGLRGQIEYAQIQVTIHTLPNRADTDADGLNDSEELNLGSDGFQTNPWLGDTDVDGISDGLESTGWARSGPTIVASANGFKTDPTRADTDHDGVRDDRDYVPLGDAFITVTIVSATVYGGTDDDPTPNALEPFVEVSYNASFAYSAYVTVASGATASYSHTYSANVADDARYASVYFWVNEYDSDDTHEAFAINGTSTFAVAGHDLSRGPGYTSYFNVTGTGTLRAAPLRVTIKTVVPDRIDARFVLPADYAGVYNVTNAAGSIVGRRYVGEPRFVALALNVTTPASWQCLISGGCDDSKVEPKVLLLPRSVFFESKLYAKLAAQDLSGLPSGLTFRQNSTTASSNSDGLQEILSGNVTSSEYLTVLDLLLRNATNAYVHRTLNLTNDLFLYGLPDEAVRLVGYKPLPSTPSVLYRFCASPNCGASPVDKPIWEKIWEGIVSTVTSWIVSAVVMAYNAFRMIVEILAQVGNWLAQQIADFPNKVASAVQAAAKVLQQVVDWITNMAVQAFETAIQGLLSLAKTALELTIGNIVELAKLAVGTAEASIEILASIATAILNLAQIIALIPLAIRVAEVAIAIATFGVGFIALKTIGRLTGEFIVHMLSLMALSLVAEYLIAETLESYEWVARSTVDFFKGIGFAVTIAAGVGKAALQVYKIYRDESLLRRTPLWRWIGFGMAIIGLMLVLYTALFNVAGEVLFFLDTVAIALGFGGLLIYWTESLNFPNRAMDTVSSMGATVEKVVVYATLPIAFTKVIVHGRTPGYG